jgi:hypothetical protein
MALLWIDGFDHYRNNAGAPSWYGAYEDAGSTAYQIAANGVVGLCYKQVSSPNLTQQNGIQKHISSKTALGVGFHYARNTNSVRTLLFALLTATNNVICSFTVGNTGNIYFNNGSLYGNSTMLDGFCPVDESFSHFEGFVTINGASSTYELRLNGVTIGADTVNLGTNPIGRVQLGGRDSINTNPASAFDNFYIWDTEGTENNTWLGERNVYTLFPDGDLSPQDWTFSTGSTAYEILDNNPPVPATAYIEASDPGDVSKVSLGALPSTDISIIGIQAVTRALKTGTSDVTIAVGPSGHPGATHSLVQDETRTFVDIWENNPNTGDPWLPSEVNNLEVEIERVT